MTASIELRVAAWTTVPPASAATLPLSVRRRVTPLGRRALEAAMAVLPRGVSPRLVFSSRHGENSRTLGLLQSLVEEGTVSPAEFSMSVHHALAGLLSIATGNHAGHTAVAAGRESFCYGLLEAAAAAAEDGAPVVLVHFDEALPEIFDAVTASPSPGVILALLLDGSGEPITLTLEPAAAPGTDDPASRFLDFLRSGADEGEATGERMAWRWRRVA